MRYIILLLLSALGLISFSCSNETPYEPVDPPLKILEIWKDAEGLFDVTGRLLILRLYDNGIAEFEEIDNTKRDRSKPYTNIDEIKVLKQINLSEERVEAFRKLINSEEFQNLENSYSPTCRYTDTQVNIDFHVLLNGEEKTISIANDCYDEPAWVNPKIPPVLKELLDLSGEARSTHRKD